MSLSNHIAMYPYDDLTDAEGIQVHRMAFPKGFDSDAVGVWVNPDGWCTVHPGEARGAERVNRLGHGSKQSDIFELLDANVGELEEDSDCLE